jgi:hypothetical protein
MEGLFLAEHFVRTYACVGREVERYPLGLRCSLLLWSASQDARRVV